MDEDEGAKDGGDSDAEGDRGDELMKAGADAGDRLGRGGLAMVAMVGVGVGLMVVAKIRICRRRFRRW